MGMGGWPWAAARSLGFLRALDRRGAEAGLVLGLIVAVVVVAGARGHCASHILHARRRRGVKQQTTRDVMACFSRPSCQESSCSAKLPCCVFVAAALPVCTRIDVNMKYILNILRVRVHINMPSALHFLCLRLFRKFEIEGELRCLDGKRYTLAATAWTICF